MPSILRPTASLAADAILVGDPGRALMLAQELLEKPKMSNHARGLWGYSGTTPAGEDLTIQSTGTGGPSAALVLADLAELGVRRAVRIGSCLTTAPDGVGDVLLVERALAAGGSATAVGVTPGEWVAPDTVLTSRLREELADDSVSSVASFDADPVTCVPFPGGVGAADMQTVALLARGATLGVAVAAVLIAVESASGPPLEDEVREELERRAGRAAAEVLSASG